MAGQDLVLGARITPRDFSPKVSSPSLLQAGVEGLTAFQSGQDTGRARKTLADKRADEQEKRQLDLDERRSERIKAISNETFQGAKTIQSDEQYQKILAGVNKRISKIDPSKVIGNMTWSKNPVTGQVSLTSEDGQALFLNNAAKTADDNIMMGSFDEEEMTQTNKLNRTKKEIEKLPSSVQESILFDKFPKLIKSLKNMTSGKGSSKAGKLWKDSFDYFTKSNNVDIKDLDRRISEAKKAFGDPEEIKILEEERAIIKEENKDISQVRMSKDPNAASVLLTQLGLKSGDQGRVDIFADINKPDPGIAEDQAQDEKDAISEVQSPLVDRGPDFSPLDKPQTLEEEEDLDSQINAKLKNIGSSAAPEAAPAKKESRLRPSQKRGAESRKALSEALFGPIARGGEKLLRGASNTLDFIAKKSGEALSSAIDDNTISLIKENPEFKKMTPEIQGRLGKLHDTQQRDILLGGGEESKDQGEIFKIMGNMSEDGVDSLSQDDIDFIEEQIRLNEEPGAKRSMTDMQMFALLELLGKR